MPCKFLERVVDRIPSDPSKRIKEHLECRYEGDIDIGGEEIECGQNCPAYEEKE